LISGHVIHKGNLYWWNLIEMTDWEEILTTIKTHK
jgi:hypothetical protein